MNEVVVMTDSAALVTPGQAPGFSWAAIFAGAFVASAVIFFLLFLGTGVGLSLFTVPQADAATTASGLTLGAIYFFAAQAFGLAVGGYMAGRLMGPVLESRDEEIFHASAHGLVAWALAVVMTATMVAVSGLALAGPGLNAAAILGAAKETNQAAPSPTDVTGYWVDMLFRPGSTGVQANVPSAVAAGPSVTAGAAAAPAEARAEAGRILAVSLLQGGKLSPADHNRLATLVSQSTGADMTEANQRVDDVQNRIQQQAIAAAEAARRFTRFISLWLAASLIFGALAASAAAVTGRWVDDEARMKPA